MAAQTLNNEKWLLQQVALGDKHAFNQILEHHRAKLYNYLFRITKSPEVSEELVMDIFLKLWFGKELISEIENLDAFLHKVAYHKALSFLRLTSRRKNLQKLVLYNMSTSAENTAIERIAEADYKALLRRAIQQLSPQQKLVFSLSRESGLTHDQIAERLKLSPNTVKNHMSDTLHSIRKYMKVNNIDTFLLFSSFLAK